MEQKSSGCCCLSFTPLDKAVTYWVMNRGFWESKGAGVTEPHLGHS